MDTKLQSFELCDKGEITVECCSHENTVKTYTRKYVQQVSYVPENYTPIQSHCTTVG